MVILGLDPGTTRIGYGVIEKVGSSLSCLDYGIIKNMGKDRISNYSNINKELSSLIERHSPDICGIESLFFFKNQKTVISVSEARGVLLYVVGSRGIRIFEPTPLQVKQAVSSYGRAGKDQVQKMVRLILGINQQIKPDDAADGLAIAICCANNIIP